MKRIVVTGGAGFIGSHLCEFLISQGHKVVCIDNFSTGSRRNISHLMTEGDNFSFIKHDITEPFHVMGGIDEIYNLACPASPKAFTENPIETLKASFMGTLNILDLARTAGAKFLHASTSEVYGEALSHPQKETDLGNTDTQSSRACYSEGKRVAEALVAEYRRKYNLNTKIVRIFNVYGSRMQSDDGRLMPNVINQLLQDKPVTIYGDGEHTRSFCYVSDMVTGLVEMMSRDEAGPINIGNPNEISIKSCIKTMAQLLDIADPVFEYKELPSGDCSRRCPDIMLAKEKLGWQPVVSLEDGLKQTIDYFKECAKV